MKKIKNILMLTITFLIIFTVKNYAFTIVIDPGHGGTDPGAIADNGSYERDLNFKIAQYLESYLKEYYDTTIYFTHDGNLTSKLELFDRAILARSYNPDLLISLHLNSIDSGTADGAEVYVTANTSCDKYNKQMTELGNKVLTNLASLGIKNGGVRTKVITKDITDVYSDGTAADWYGIIRYAMRGTKIDYGVTTPEGWTSANVQNGEGVSTLLVEHCYLKGTDIQYIDSDADLKKLAEADGKAIAEYYGLRKKSEVVSGVTLNKTELDLVKGDTYNLIATVTPSTATNKKVTWSSSNKNVATVDENGKVTAISEGTTIVSVKTEDQNKIETVTVNVRKLNVSKTSVELEVSESVTVTASCSPKKAGDSFEWSSSNENVAKVENGVITAVSSGDAIITVKLNSTEIDLKQEILVKVYAEEGSSTEEILGDVDKNGRITVTDARYIIGYVLGEKELSEEQKKVADVDSNGRILVSDARKILSYILDGTEF